MSRTVRSMPYDTIPTKKTPAPIDKDRAVRSWSFSSLKNYEECPARFKYARIDKIVPKEPEDRKALIRGEKYHKDAENYLKGHLSKPPEGMKLVEESMVQLKKFNPTTEEMWCFDRWWRYIPTDERGFAIDYSDKDRIWVRIKIDAYFITEVKTSLTAVTIDFKTGKIKPDHEDQLELYALGTMVKHPEVDFVTPEMWYTDERLYGIPDVRMYDRSMIDPLIMKWEQKLKQYFTDTRFSMKPGRHCMWCPFSKAKKGPCKF